MEPVFGIIKHGLGFRQFLVRGLEAVTGEWKLVALAFNLKRMHVLAAAWQGNKDKWLTKNKAATGKTGPSLPARIDAKHLDHAKT